MVTINVSKSGIDSNPGTAALPKLTYGAAAAAAPGTSDIVIMKSGVYSEGVTGSFSHTVKADGVVKFDGENSITNFMNRPAGTGSTVPKFEGLIFRRYTNVIQRTRGISPTFTDCLIEDCERLKRATAGGDTITMTRTTVSNCTKGIETPGSSAVPAIISCVFVENGVAIEAIDAGGSMGDFRGNIFRSNGIHIKLGAAAQYNAVSDGNDFSPIDASNKFVVASVDQLTLAAWQAAVGADNTFTIDKDPEFLDQPKRLYILKPTSPALTSGLLSVADRVVGAFNRKLSGGDATGDGFSINRNPTIWNDPSGAPAGTAVVSTSGGPATPDLIQNAVFNWILAPGKGVGTITFTIPFAVARLVGRVFAIQRLFYPLGVIDHDPTDTNPNRLTIEIAIDVGAGLGPFVAVEPDSHVNDPTTGFRDVSPATPLVAMAIKATLRKTGVSA